MNKHLTILGSTMFIPGVKKVYIEQANISNVTKLSTMAHEYGHGVAALLNNERYTNDTSLFNETESIFIELLSRDITNLY